jgi:hypothetical protein
MQKRIQHDIFQYLIAGVWIINGLYCKVLNLVPRHQQIVERILGIDDARTITILIGIAEIGMATWIMTGFKKRSNALTQIVVIIAMNGLELFLASDLLLWGKANAVFAMLFAMLIYYNAFHDSNKPKQPAVC